MARITLGRTGITAEQNAFGALPIQRVTFEEAGKLLNMALDGGMDFIDTARAYSDSEEKIGRAVSHRRNEYTLATKTMTKTPEGFWRDLHTSLKNLNTDHIDIYQFHQVGQCWRPGDGSGMYECMQKAKAQGKILHISATTHKIGVAREIAESGLYDTVQFPFSYLSGQQEIDLVNLCRERNVGFIAMKALSGGLLTNSAAAYAFIAQFDNVLPIWGVQRESELLEFLSYMDNPPALTEDMRALIARDKEELGGDFCRGCGYCMPCPAGIEINNCARMIQMIRRSPSARWLEPDAQAKMERIAHCLHCGKCMQHCPYGLKIPDLLEKNLDDYRKIVAGEISV
ncbi:MAG: aldo/keto reductase [Clostridia bacterium]|nr:aldo/keto reductase [Clostridia bacterium]